MKLAYQPLLFILLLLNTVSFASNKNTSNNTVEEYITDTIYSVDTISLAPDPNSVVLSKEQYDSLLLASQKKESSKERKADEKRHNLNIFDEVSILTADYQHIGIQTGAHYKNSYLYISGGTNFNADLPIIGGIGLCQKIQVLKKLSLEPELLSLWYFPISSNLKTQNNNHFLIGLAYKLLPDLGIKLSPSIYCGWRNSVSSNKEYNDIIHIISPYKPFSAEETSANSTFDIGTGLSLAFVYNFR